MFNFSPVASIELLLEFSAKNMVYSLSPVLLYYAHKISFFPVLSASGGIKVDHPQMSNGTNGKNRNLY